jgi:hypothetical protein
MGAAGAHGALQANVRARYPLSTAAAKDVP